MAFALGVWLDWIVNVGQNRYYFDPEREFTRPDNPLRPPRENFIADGRAKARDNFARQARWVGKINEVFADLVWKEGAPQVATRLTKAIEEIDVLLTQTSRDSLMDAEYREEKRLLKQKVDELLS